MANPVWSLPKGETQKLRGKHICLWHKAQRLVETEHQVNPPENTEEYQRQHEA